MLRGGVCESVTLEGANHDNEGEIERECRLVRGAPCFGHSDTLTAEWVTMWVPGTGARVGKRGKLSGGKVPKLLPTRTPRRIAQKYGAAERPLLVFELHVRPGAMAPPRTPPAAARMCMVPRPQAMADTETRRRVMQKPACVYTTCRAGDKCQTGPHTPRAPQAPRKHPRAAPCVFSFAGSMPCAAGRVCLCLRGKQPKAPEAASPATTAHPGAPPNPKTKAVRSRARDCGGRQLPPGATAARQQQQQQSQPNRRGVPGWLPRGVVGPWDGCAACISAAAPPSLEGAKPQERGALDWSLTPNNTQHARRTTRTQNAQRRHKKREIRPLPTHRPPNVKSMLLRALPIARAPQHRLLLPHRARQAPRART